ncbi:MAG: sugar phosphate isomerase/epimerase family protein [Armatimonadota bacterium]
MYLNLNPNPISIQSPTTPLLISLATRYGFTGIDLTADALQSRKTAEAAGQAVAEAGLRWGLFALPCDISNAGEADFRDGMRRLQQLLPLVQLAGCTRTYNHIWPGSYERPYQENFRWHTERIKAVADLLGEYEVMLGLEFIGPKTLRDTFPHPFIHTLEEVLELADAAGSTVGIVLDFFHWYTSGGTLETLRGLLPVERLVNVHANDAIAGRSCEAQLDLERAMPLSTGVIDAPAIIAWLKEIGYEGPIIVEPFTPTTTRFAAMPAEQVAEEVGASLRSLIASG